MIVIWLAAGLLAGAGASAPAVGGGRLTFEEAQRSHESRDRRTVRDLVDSLEPERPSKPKKVKTTPVAGPSMPAIVPQLVTFAPSPIELLTADDSALREAQRLAAMIETTPIPEDPAAIALLMMLLEAT